MYQIWTTTRICTFYSPHNLVDARKVNSFVLLTTFSVTKWKWNPQGLLNGKTIKLATLRESLWSWVSIDNTVIRCPDDGRTDVSGYNNLLLLCSALISQWWLNSVTWFFIFFFKYYKTKLIAGIYPQPVYTLPVSNNNYINFRWKRVLYSIWDPCRPEGIILSLLRPMHYTHLYLSGSNSLWWGGR